MNRITLKLELDFDFIVLAITTSLKDYRLCFQLNKFALANFVRIEELGLSSSGSHSVALFNRYAYLPENTETEFYLLSNKGSEGLLIPEMNRVDYFLIIKNFIDEEDLEAWLSHLKQIPDVLAAVEVDVKKLKSKENLLF
ncbi:MAG: IPExxxVDY family protein [Sphingobacteriaceae bacterium]